MTTTRLLRHVNSQRCLRLLCVHGPQSKADLARELGVTKTTVGYAVAELIDSGLVIERAPEPVTVHRGRPGNTLVLNPSGAYFVGIEVESTHISGTLCDFSLAVLGSVNVTLELSMTSAEHVAARLRQIVDELVSECGLAHADVYGIGASISGIVTPTGKVYIPTFSLWNGIDFAKILGDAMPGDWVITCCNDAAAAAFLIAERLHERAKESILVLLLANGIGSAVIRHGVVDRGANGVAGEIGLLRLSEELSTSRRTFQDAAGYAHFSELVDPTMDASSALSILAAIEDPDEAFSEALSIWSDRLAGAMLNAIYLLDPAMIVVSGSLSVLYPRVADAVNDKLRSAFIPGLSLPPIVVDGPRQPLPAIGAAALLREELFLLPALGSAAA